MATSEFLELRTKTAGTSTSSVRPVRASRRCSRPWALQDIERGHGLAVIDPHGDLVERIAAQVPARRAPEVIYLNASDPSQPYGYNSLRRVRGDRIALAASGFIEVFKKMWPKAWGVRMEHILRNVFMALLEHRLNVSDLEEYVATRTAKIATELKITQENEKRLAIQEGSYRVLTGRNVIQNGEVLLKKHLDDCVAIETVDGQRVIRVRGEDGKSLIGGGADGLATLEEVAMKYVEQYPAVFDVAGKRESSPAARRGKILTRPEFDRLDPITRAQRMRDGYTLVEGPPVSSIRVSARPGEKIISRAQFDQLQPKERAAKFAEGFRLVD
ncbi:hypothetical protein [Bradyrhizobium sp. CCBAU 25360]|uniref:hypothetical protein n=1 Tax=Bradyrhizobium sp. CCBAU 25360 TaxID=858425 RepID=UPI002306D310|nr:hypothetical protein [Bradyrhizobium sp. CCBAU 25360]